MRGSASIRAEGRRAGATGRGDGQGLQVLEPVMDVAVDPVAWEDTPGTALFDGTLHRATRLARGPVTGTI